MKNYYKILEIDESASKDDIKKAYRTLSKKYHPDLNQGSKSSEDSFKLISEAYSVLSDQSKKSEYDRTRNPRNNSFDDFVNNFGSESFKRESGFGGRSNGFNRQSTQNRGIPKTDYLDINNKVTVELKDAILGKPIELKYKKWEVNSEFNRVEVDKSINIHLDLKKKNIAITKNGSEYIIKIKLDKLGNEDVHRRTNIWGEVDNILLGGDFHLNINLNVPENIDIEDNNIIQFIDVPLYKALFKGEKVRVSTILDKTYDAEISNPKKLNNLRFNIEGQGIMGKAGKLGNYIIKFNIISPDLSKISKANLKILKDSIIKD